jgi:hypothetical protein
MWKARSAAESAFGMAVSQGEIVNLVHADRALRKTGFVHSSAIHPQRSSKF